MGDIIGRFEPAREPLSEPADLVLSGARRPLARWRRPAPSSRSRAPDGWRQTLSAAIWAERLCRAVSALGFELRVPSAEPADLHEQNLLAK